MNEEGTFMWAVEQMKLGKKVACDYIRKIDKTHYYYMDKMSYSTGKFKTIFSSNGIQICPSLNIYEATDWVVVDDEDWNLAEHWKDFPYKTQYNVAVKKCRNLILKDIYKLVGRSIYEESTGLIHSSKKADVVRVQKIVKERFGDLE